MFCSRVCRIVLDYFGGPFAFVIAYIGNGFPPLRKYAHNVTRSSGIVFEVLFCDDHTRLQFIMLSILTICIFVIMF